MTAPQNAPRRVHVLGGNRIPFGKIGGAYRGVSNRDMMTAALDGLIARYSLQNERIGEVAGGAVLKRAADFNLTRESVLGTALDPHTPAIDMQKACATGLETLNFVTAKIRLGQIDSGIAGGVDSASDAPIEVSDSLRRKLHTLSRAKTAGQRLSLVGSLRPSDFAPLAPRNSEPRTGLSMGEHQAITTREWGITREEQDELAAASHRNLAAAYEEGFFDTLMTGYRGCGRDEFLRPDTTVEKLAGLKTVFGKEQATMTAGNSTGLSDGASAVLVGTEEWAAARGLTPLAEVVDFRAAATDYVHGDEGLLMAPVEAMPRLLADNGLTIDDIDFFEIHEAFAGTVLSTLKAWESREYMVDRLGFDDVLGTVPREKLNVKGSSLAAGHPFAATGGRIVASLATMLRTAADDTGRTQRGVISVCAASGQGVVCLLQAEPVGQEDK
ncbi:acetyl-CoA C-acetyltransferase [Helcobacillus massiliensis]|uniref:Acetyl-CoA C-acetyltransferase n=1 Tax=Helcobacillus massiliensis TaxID=521392 RepID=A0A839QRJ2_9MICO|nr:acetyl-CoA C-acetyltransferase [Helcobacillus massiliensis]MCG7426236.1 acetyl-CoA C-acetyltransferase [Helcobacillus sp. ACRRO]MBB3022914.1 acetyl-CoA C-acetyltransferase [Helcobacillus massiliensis]MCT1558577.1 acetyl-CoA C-acetyltransferase [Helcobacillus massiliensis]MCT2037227.1 acetyl-CoA C-acetyltransferase [Helcobacillus massiliensis]MCT2332401.1 acetyl-CoA C-acetyltransferase [Helcobacillus massiliensis]